MLGRLAARLVVHGIMAAVKSGQANVPELTETIKRVEMGDTDGAELTIRVVIVDLTDQPAKRPVLGRATALLAEIIGMQGRFRLAEKTWARALSLLDGPRDKEVAQATRERLIAARNKLIEVSRTNDTAAAQALVARWVELSSRFARVGDARQSEEFLRRAHTVAICELGLAHPTTVSLAERRGAIVQN
jgi:hypothetical protein